MISVAIRSGGTSRVTSLLGMLVIGTLFSGCGAQPAMPTTLSTGSAASSADVSAHPQSQVVLTNPVGTIADRAKERPFIITAFQGNTSTIYQANDKFTKFTTLVTFNSNFDYVQSAEIGPKSELYVSNCTQELTHNGIYPYNCKSGATDVFPPGSSQPIVIANGGNGVSVAKDGRFVTASGWSGCGSCAVTISEFRPGKKKPFLATPFKNWIPWGLYISPDGQGVYFLVSLGEPSAIGGFPWGELGSYGSVYSWQCGGPSGICGQPWATFIDSSNTLYAALSAIGPTEYSDSGVVEYPAGASEPSVTIRYPNVYMPIGLAVYKGNLYVANSGPGTNTITEFAPGQTTPLHTYKLPFSPTSLSLATRY
jgi:hypothetical protein